MNWVGTGPDGKRIPYVHGEVLRSDPPGLLQYTFAVGPSGKFSRVPGLFIFEGRRHRAVDRGLSKGRVGAPALMRGKERFSAPGNMLDSYHAL
jgi:hypothetical protein